MLNDCMVTRRKISISELGNSIFIFCLLLKLKNLHISVLQPELSSYKFSHKGGGGGGGGERDGSRLQERPHIVGYLQPTGGREILIG